MSDARRIDWIVVHTAAAYDTVRRRVVYQSVEGLRSAMPGHTGDWYFTGDYPTPGGFRVVNRAFINYIEKRHGRAYEAARG